MITFVWYTLATPEQPHRTLYQPPITAL